jgi:hypothetical protein
MTAAPTTSPIVVSHATSLRLRALRMQHEGLMLRLALHQLEPDRLDDFVRHTNRATLYLCSVEDVVRGVRTVPQAELDDALNDAADALYAAKRVLDEVL